MTLALAAEAFEEDCRRAALVVSQRTAPPCAARVIDRTAWPRTGASALYRTPKGWEIVASHPPGYDRPWARPPRPGRDVAPTSRIIFALTSPVNAPSRSKYRFCAAMAIVV